MKAGWQLKELQDICSFENGDRGENYPSKSVQTTSGIPFINAGHLTDSGIDFAAMSYIPVERFHLLGNGKIRRDDILFCLRGSLGKFASVGDLSEGAIASSLVIVRPKEGVLDRYLMAYFQSSLCSDMINLFKNGAAQPNLSAGSLKKFSIPVPTIPEQHQIVGILDKAFDGIAKARANTEKNLQNARDLFESHLQSAFAPCGGGWRVKPLGEMALFRNGINFSKSSKGDSLKILGVKDFKDNYWAPLDALETVTTDGTLPESDTLLQNDLVFVRSNGNPELIGRCLLIGEVNERTTHSGFTIRARLHTSEIAPKYLCHFLKSNSARRTMIDGGNGANIKSLNQGTLSNLVIPFPSASEQALIVGRIEELHEEIKRLTFVYQQKLVAIDQLKKSLLHQAFSGNL
ncbi:restriction endonuclease subunit S [Pseudomonas haemolytica]|nr:restriction endonuclease subunit S [Pseudomonas haemolytica]